VNSGVVVRFLEDGIYTAMSASPNGEYFMTTSLAKPYSFIVPYSRFPQDVKVVDGNGKLIKVIVNIPISENIPKGFGATRMGPRSFSWRADAPATLTYVEALDGGDPKKDADFRDQMMIWEAPFSSAASFGPKTKLRYGKLLAAGIQINQQKRQQSFLIEVGKTSTMIQEVFALLEMNMAAMSYTLTNKKNYI